MPIVYTPASMSNSRRFIRGPPGKICRHATIGRDDPVTGNHQRQRVGRHAVAHRPGSPWRSGPGGKLPVGEGLPVADSPALLDHAALELCEPDEPRCARG